MKFIAIHLHKANYRCFVKTHRKCIKLKIFLIIFLNKYIEKLENHFTGTISDSRPLSHLYSGVTVNFRIVEQCP